MQQNWLKKVLKHINIFSFIILRISLTLFFPFIDVIVLVRGCAKGKLFDLDFRKKTSINVSIYSGQPAERQVLSETNLSYFIGVAEPGGAEGDSLVFP